MQSLMKWRSIIMNLQMNKFIDVANDNDKYIITERYLETIIIMGQLTHLL